MQAVGHARLHKHVLSKARVGGKKRASFSPRCERVAVEWGSEEGDGGQVCQGWQLPRQHGWREVWSPPLPSPQALTALPPYLQSTAKKMDVIKGLFVACRHSEARFIAR